MADQLDTGKSCHPPGPMIGSLTGLLTVIAGIAVTWAVMHATYPVFRIPKEFEVRDIGRPAAEYVANRHAQEKVDRQHAMLYVGLLGLVIGLGLLAGEAIVRRNPVAPLVACACAAVGGIIGGQLGSRVHEWTIEHVGQPDLLHTVYAQGALLAPLGLAIGLGVGLSMGRWTAGLKTGVAGLFGGAAAAALYPIAMSLLLPTVSTDHLLPLDARSRFLWLALTAGLIVAFVVAAVAPCRHGKPTTAPPAEN